MRVRRTRARFLRRDEVFHGIPASGRAAVAPLWLGALVSAQLLLFAAPGPINMVIVGVVAPAERATAVALSIFAIHAFATSLQLGSSGADATSLATGVLVVPAMVLAAGAIWT
jgi:hypothetical protein